MKNKFKFNSTSGSEAFAISEELYNNTDNIYYIYS